MQGEFELHAKAVPGLPVDVALRSPGASAVIYGQLDASGIAFDDVRTRRQTSACRGNSHSEFKARRAV